MQHRIWSIGIRKYVLALIKPNGEVWEVGAKNYEPFKVEYAPEILSKDGKHIYENDIVKHRFKRCWNDGEHVSKVEFDNKFCCFYLNNGISKIKMRDDIQYEVLGNINETPELINLLGVNSTSNFKEKSQTIRHIVGNKVLKAGSFAKCGDSTVYIVKFIDSLTALVCFPNCDVQDAVEVEISKLYSID